MIYADIIKINIRLLKDAATSGPDSVSDCIIKAKKVRRMIQGFKEDYGVKDKLNSEVANVVKIFRQRGDFCELEFQLTFHFNLLQQ